MIRLRPGDIIGMRSYDAVGRIINYGTWGARNGISHISIVAEHPHEEGELLIYESTTQCPLDCEFAHRKVSGVQAHNPYARIESYYGGVWVYRLTPELNKYESARLTKFLHYHVGTEYDYRGALRARDSGFMLRYILPASGLETLFCSEYVAAALQCLERVDLSYGNGWSPNRLRRYLFAQNIVRLVGQIKPTPKLPEGCL